MQLDVIFDAEGDVAHGVVEEVLADAGRFVQHRDTELVELIAGAYSREHQNVGRFQRAGAEDDLVGLDGEYLAAAFRLHPDHSW